MDQFASARKTLEGVREQLLGMKNVVATGIGYKKVTGEKTPTMSIVCSVTEKVAEAALASSDRVPAMLDGIATDVVATGPIRALQSPTERHRPAPGGVSIGHRDITAGTLGCLVKKDGQIHILSNNHVLANSNDAGIGDPILQPGSHDGGSYPDDHIANLTDFIPISFVGAPSDCGIAGTATAFLNGIAQLLGSDTRLQAIKLQQTDNLVDAAIARPLNDTDVIDQILGIGSIQGTAEAELGMGIKKSGRTTGLTTGEVEQLDVTVNVQYGAGRIARFTDQIMAGAMSQGGDSGSAVLNEDNQLIGLLYAGSDSSTIINRITNVFSALRVGL